MKKILVDFIPLILFFIAYKYAGIYVATAVAIVASMIQLIYLKIRREPIKAVNWLNASVIIVFGTLTIVLHDKYFIYWKPTVLYWLFAAILLFGHYVRHQNYLTTLLQGDIQLPAFVWRNILHMWVIFFVLMGLLNLFVAFSGFFTESQWVTFKAFGTTILSLIFVVGQSIYMSRYLNDSSQS